VSPGSRRAAFVFIAAPLSFAVAYMLLEIGVQAVARLGGIGEYGDLSYFEEKLAEALRHDGRHPAVPVDPEVGWVQGVLVSGDATDETSTVLFLGDSVTYGELATRGEDDYVTRVGNALAADAVRVVNAAASGYGIDQMALRLPREIEAFAPDLVVVAYIPHDLRRIGRTHFIRMPKPMLDVKGPGLMTRPPEDIGAYYARQAGAVSGFRYGAWLVAERWRQRRYAFPGANLDWYEAVLGRIASRIAGDTRRAGAELVFAEIPNYADEASTRWLRPLMRRVLEAGARAGAWRFVVLEDCLRERASGDAWPTADFAEQHPGPAGHADLAACTLREVVEPARS